VVLRPLLVLLVLLLAGCAQANRDRDGPTQRTLPPDQGGSNAILKHKLPERTTTVHRSIQAEGTLGKPVRTNFTVPLRADSMVWTLTINHTVGPYAVTAGSQGLATARVSWEKDPSKWFGRTLSPEAGYALQPGATGGYSMGRDPARPGNWVFELDAGGTNYEVVLEVQVHEPEKVT
jgi:hypothetical protein